MFSPPPSPILTPPRENADAGPHPSLRDAKQRVASRTKWSILLVPAILILITLSTHYMPHPVLLDFLSQGDLSFDPDQSKWTFHEVHPRQVTTLVSSSLPPASSSSLSSSPTSTPAPTIPTNPTLPTPFPQPFDTTLSHNFSTVACSNFFDNMTLAFDFRQCRSFSLLMESSSAFSNAQGNITLLNGLVWGTCNTDVSATQCISTMNEFATSLRSTCSTDLTNGNVFVSNALIGLLTYSLMRGIGCQANPSTNAYCYVSAVDNTNPSDLFFYQLPYGIAVPNNTILSCSSCTKSMMAMFLAVVKGTDPDTTDSMVRSVLSRTYSSASQLSANTCGSDYVQTTTVISGGMRSFVVGWSVIAAVVICWVVI